MRSFKSEVALIKHEVLKHIVRLLFDDKLEEEINRLPRTLTNMGLTHYRCCVYKERAVLAERVKFALGFSPKEVDEEERLGQIVRDRLKDHEIKLPVLDIIEIACDRCPIDKYLVTDACRGCVAHYCVNACPKKAITIVGRRAYIDQEHCVECGRCSKACKFHAIVEVSRPCERSCPADAIKPGPKRNSVIHQDMCTSCGTCTTACPFGAITDKSQIYQVVNWLKQGTKVIAAVAPAIAGQFGPKVKMGQIFSALIKVGFAKVAEVALGADEVAKLEAEEFKHLVEDKKWVASSCCPAFVSIIKKHFPEFEDHIAQTPSPMVVLGRRLKRELPDYKVVFIGPCIAKKEEAMAQDSGIDAVLTFEELDAIFDARDINFTDLSEIPSSFECATSKGRGFAVSGGVAEAVNRVLEEGGLSGLLKPVRANGLEECKKLLSLARAGKLEGNFLEGMACEGGCVGGPATLVEAQKSAKAVENYKMTC
ncbi:MAG TPA: 4Fe-4S binding protein [Thermoanaerobacterales bacterium]|nr:4Fe-4S binding protein [Thermoanaerobacterales bacterium]